MMNATDQRPDDRGVFAACESLAEILVVLNTLSGIEAVDQLLADSDIAKDTLREVADKFAAIGLKPMAQLVRKYARRAKRPPERDWWMIPNRHERHAAFVGQGGKLRGQRRTGRVY